MAELPYLSLDVSALITDTTHLTTEQFGAYVRILCAMWREGAELPADDAALARIAGVTPKRWAAIRDVVLAPIEIVEGILYQKRLSQTWDGVQKIRVRRMAAANERWNQKRARDAHASRTSHAHAYANASPGTMQMQSTCNANSKRKNITTTCSVAPRASETAAKSAQPPDTSGHQDELVEAPSKAPTIASDELSAVLQAKRWVP